MPVPVHAMPLPVPTEILHAMLAQGRLVTDLLEGGTPYDSWGRIGGASQYVPPPPYTATELEQLRSMNVPFRGIPNYRDVSMTNMKFVTLVSRCVGNHCMTMRKKPLERG